MTTINGIYAHGGNGAVNISSLTTLSISGAGGGNFTVAGDVAGAGTINLTGGTFYQNLTASSIFFTSPLSSSNWAFKNLQFINGGVGPSYTITTQSLGSGAISLTGALSVGNSNLGDQGPIVLWTPEAVVWTLSAGGTAFNTGSSLCPNSTCSDNTSTFIFTNPGNVTYGATLGYYNITRTASLVNNNINDATAGAVTVANNFSITPSSGGPNVIFDTFQLGGALTVGGTLSIVRPNFAVTTLTSTVFNWPLTAGTLSIANGWSGGNDTLTANSSIITLTGIGNTPLHSEPVT